MKVDSEVTKSRTRDGGGIRGGIVPYAVPVRRFRVEASAGVGQRDSGYRRPGVPLESAAAPASGPRANTTVPCDAS